MLSTKFTSRFRLCTIAATLTTQCALAQTTVSLEFLGRTTRSGYDVTGAEIVTFDPTTNRAFVVNGLTAAIDVFDLSLPSSPVALTSISTLPFGSGLQSIAFKNGVLAAAVAAIPDTNPGQIVFFDAYGAFLGSRQVGALPDMVCFTPDGTKVISANEGQPNPGYTIDPEGSISIITLGTGANVITAATVVTLGFNALPAGTIDPSIVPFGLGTPSIGQDLEPECVAVAADSQSAWVTLQEHSAIAVLDLSIPAITSVRPLGTKKHALGIASLTTSTLMNPPTLGTTTAGQSIALGGFSGLWFDSINASTGVITFLATPDRGPNCEPVNVDGDAALERPFALPDFQPRVCTLSYNPATNALALTGTMLLRKPDGTPMSGLPNLLGQAAGFANTDEQPCDLFGQPLTLDPLGGDIEGIVRTSDGTLWACDEYRPALYHFDATGLMLDRFVPIGANAFGVNVGTESFPAVYSQRRDNRGFEAIATWNNQIYCFMQSPLDNPDVANDANSKASRNVRILKFNPSTNAVVAEYIYVLEGGASDKLGDACAFAPGKFLVVERDALIGTSAKKKIFEINLAGATDVSQLSSAIAGPGGTLDRMTPAQLATAGIVPVSKSVYLDLAAVGYADFSDKVEGLAMRDPSTLYVINDNDFQMQGTFDATTGLLTANPSPLPTVLGVMTFTGNGLDASDQDSVIAIKSWPVEGAYMPDAVEAFSSNGESFFITANEGDSREFGPFLDLLAVGAANLDKQVFPGADWLKNNARLGRLQARKDLGDLDGDGDWDRIVAMGGRSFSIWNAAGARVWDSGDFLEQKTAATYPSNFNASNTNNTKDNRSRSKGPEPEGVTVGRIGTHQYLFGLCERIGGIMAFNIDDPSAPVFQTYINSRDFTFATNNAASGDLGPEGIQFVSALDSPTNQPLILLANEISGTLSIYQVNTTCDIVGDINEDCVVSAEDLATLLAGWGDCPAKGACQGDLNLDGVIDASDLALLLSNWG